MGHEWRVGNPELAESPTLKLKVQVLDGLIAQGNKAADNGSVIVGSPYQIQRGLGL